MKNSAGSPPLAMLVMYGLMFFVAVPWLVYVRHFA